MIVCYSCVFVCSSYLLVCYLCVTRRYLCVPVLRDSYVFVCTGMYSCVTRMLPVVLVWCFSHDPAEIIHSHAHII